MKIIPLIALSLTLVPGPELSFVDKRMVNAGKYKEGETILVTSKIKNSGNEDLMFLSAIASCNCSSVAYPKEPVTPGQEAEIIVLIDTKGKSGPGTVVVKLITNTADKYSIMRVDYEIIK